MTKEHELVNQFLDLNDVNPSLTLNLILDNIVKRCGCKGIEDFWTQLSKFIPIQTNPKTGLIKISLERFLTERYALNKVEVEIIIYSLKKMAILHQNEPKKEYWFYL